jgi:FkbM family methyltransferase
MNGTTSNTSLSLSSAAAETFLDTTNNNATETAVPNLTNETISNMTLSQEATNETATTNTTVPNETVINETVINATLPAAVESPPEANTTASVPGEATNETSTSNVTSPLAAESMPQETSNGTTTGNMTLAVPPTIAESTEPQPQDQQLPPPAPVPTPGEATNETASNVTGSITTAESVPQETMNGTTSKVTSPLPLTLAEVSRLEQPTNETAGNMTLPLPATDVKSTAPEANGTNVSNATLTTLATNAESILEEPNNQQAPPASAATNDGASGKSIGNIEIDQYLANCSEAMAKNSPPSNIVKTSTHPEVNMSVHPRRQDTAVSKSIIETGCSGCHILNATLSALESNPDSILLDIGANIGLFGLTAAASGHLTYSFEPVRNNWVKTCESFQENSPVVREHMTLFKTALSSSGPQLIHFANKWRSYQPAFVQVKPQGQLDLPKKGTQGVDWGVAITLDSLQDYLPNDKPVVIKMDVVGHECEVFAGAMDYLSRVSIVHLVMEFTADQVNCPNREAIFKLLTETHGLSPYRWEETPNLRRFPLDINELDGWTGGPYDVEWIKQTPNPDLKAA